ncbi:MAG: phenylalanine--tRNA ligase subunit beta, partial [Candidatus Moranbacteria bacterium]|nr:phenylalanine--tRNA ligase subunit beta [Candidatus Moranbacteria bacterium]
MKFSYNWLKELSGTNESVEKIARELTLHSFEVEKIEDLGKNLDKVVIGEVLEVKKHPDADKLKVAKVDISPTPSQSPLRAGGEAGALQIVCGAPNLKAGQKVPVALAGAVLQATDDKGQGTEIEIKKSDIRGVQSEGMICAEDELGLGKEHAGIMVLDKDAPVGEKFSKYLKLDDSVLEIDVLPNRAHDCLSHEGVALELEALASVGNVKSVQNVKDEIKNKTFSIDEMMRKSKADGTSLSVSIDTDKCARYIGIRIKNIKVGESPDRIRSRLIACGINPINNIVDITNYVMLETGQPLHAFDAKKVSKILVRQAEQGGKLKLLDDSEIELSEKDIVITDGEKPIALAGIMGGAQSAIDEKTSEIILESASFDYVSVRLSQKYHNLKTEAGHRFEKEIDPNISEHAAIKAAEMIARECGGKIDSFADAYPDPVSPWTINLNTESLNKLLGIIMDKKEVVKILERLGIGIEEKKDFLIANIPTRRIDLQTQEDLIEEVGRIYGYEKISPVPLMEKVQSPKWNEVRYFDRLLKDMAVFDGFDEVKVYSFYSKDDAKALGLNDENHVALLNPMSSDQTLVRRTLIGGLIRACKKSLSYFDSVHIFDLGRVYAPKNKSLPEEKLLFSLAVAEKGEKGEQFYLLKGVLEDIFYRIGIEDYYYDDSFEENNEDIIALHPSRKALIRSSSGEILGYIGEITKKANKYFGIKNARVAVSEIDVERLLEFVPEDRDFEPLARFPEVERDLSMIVDEFTRVADVERLLYGAGGELVKDIDLFDLYVDPETEERSMAFHIRFAHPERTLK